jgi:carbon-monoxide dehydrogenase medium subunit
MIKSFEYLAPQTLDEALALLEQHGDECKVIAGGQSLLILMRQGLVAPAYLLDIKGLPGLAHIKFDPKEGLTIGALATHRAIEKSPEIQQKFGVLSEMERRLASIQTRNWGTIGGNLCHADPAGDPAPVLIALCATVTVTSTQGPRTVPLEDFVLDYFETAMKHTELLTEIRLPVPAPQTGTVYSKFNVIESELGTVGVAVSITLRSKDRTCGDARIVLGGAGPRPLRAKRAEELLRGKQITDRLLKDAADRAAAESQPISDINASADYRRELLKVQVRRMAAEALSRAEKN